MGVRMVKANSMDLSLFQFDYDMTFAAFFMNADKTIYGRYGTRSEYKLAAKEMSLPSFRIALERAIKLHQRYPQNKHSLLAKTGPTSKQRIPEDFPKLRSYRSDLDYSGKVLQSCIHCHQVLDAKRDLLRTEGKPVAEKDLFPYPLPDLIGLELDPMAAAQVKRVLPGSPAEKGGFRAGDDIVKLGGQPILSIADVQWVLHHAASPAVVKATVRRDGRLLSPSVSIPVGWRQQNNIHWRATTWEMNRLVGGSLKWANLSPAGAKKARADVGIDRHPS